MSDILIKGMDMPTSCYKCPLRRRDGMDIVCPVAHERFSVAGVNILEYRLDNCPLVPVPKHGRCIDVDVLEDNNITYYAIPVLANVTDATIREAELVIRLKDLDNAPTIIPPSEEGKT